MCVCAHMYKTYIRARLLMIDVITSAKNLPAYCNNERKKLPACTSKNKKSACYVHARCRDI